MKDALTLLFILWVVGALLKAWMAKNAPEQYQKMVEAEQKKKERNHKMLGLGVDIASKFLKR